MKSCRHFEKCPKIEKDLMELMFSEKTQEASIKSLHKRQDKADEMREDLSEKVNDLIVIVHDIDIKFKTHMEWEEQMGEINSKNKETNSAFIKWVAGFVIVGLISFTGYTLEVISKTEKATITNAKQLENVDETLKDIKQLIIRNKE